MTRTQRGLAMLLSAAIVAATTSTAHAMQYTFTELGFYPALINASGQMVYSNYVWTPDGHGGGTTADLGAVPGGLSATPSAINASGQVTGIVRSDSGGRYVLWTPSGGTYSAIVLPEINPQGSEEVYQNGLNDRGQVTGAGWDFYSGYARSFLWNPTTPNAPSGTSVGLGRGDGVSLEFRSINASGQITGEYGGYTSDNPGTAVLWKPSTPNGTSGTMVDIGGLYPEGTNGGIKINASGQVVGNSQSVDANFKAFLWTPDVRNGTTGSMVDLGTLSDSVHLDTRARDLNDAGVVVGDSWRKAFVWTAADGIRDLKDLVVDLPSGWHLDSAVGINNGGMIIGAGSYDPDGPGGVPEVSRGFLLTPTPEPGSLGLLGVGGIALLARRRRR